MRDSLAEKLLAQVLGWQEGKLTKESTELKAMANLKYDGYQQFSPGIRFVESLALWLNQLDASEDRDRAYNFMKKNMIYFSQAEMDHFVEMVYPEFIQPTLVEETAEILGCPTYKMTTIVASQEYKTLLRRCLFLGLSDGAHTDTFRRHNPDISHEQVYQDYSPGEERIQGFLDSLGEDLERTTGGNTNNDDRKFRNIFLLDDFAGSGRSCMNRDGESHKYNGKIFKLLDSLCGSKGRMEKLVDMGSLSVHVIFYVATTRAIEYIRTAVNEWLGESEYEIEFDAKAIQIIPEEVRVVNSMDPAFIQMLPRHFDDKVNTSHYKTGKHDAPYLGYDECALPLVLHHNCPNNSIPLLWSPEGGKFRGLFPRVNRHRDVT